MQTVNQPPAVSIIIPAYNEEAVITRCITAAQSQTLPAHEILVVDNRSSDRTAAIVERLVGQDGTGRLRLLRQDAEQGLIPTRNAGFEAASGDVLGRIDADTVIAPDWVQRVSGGLADGRIGAATGPVSYYDLPHQRAAGIADDLARRGIRRLGTAYPFLYGSNMAMRADAWRQIRPSVCDDRDDRLHEDIDLSVHLYEAAIRVGYLPGMRASVSARRLFNSPSEFRDYTRRFERTYASHDVARWYLKVPQVLLEGLYWPLRMARGFSAASSVAA